MRDRAWIGYVLLAAAATAAYFGAGHNSYLFNAIGLSSPVAIVFAARLHRPESRLPWFLFAIGQALFITGDVFSYNYDAIFGEYTFPSVADALYLAVYPSLVAGLLVLVNRRRAGRDRAALIDSLMVAIGVGTISWVFLVAPYANDTTLTGLEKATLMAYPLMDLVLLVAAFRLAVGAGRRPTSFYLLMSGIITLFVTDAIYGWLLLTSGYEPGSGWLELGWAAFYVLFGAAALHPSMRRMTERPEDVEHEASRSRLIMLGGASLLAPLGQALQVWRGEDVDLPIVLGATFTLFILVMTRMASLVREQQRSAARERVLREAAQDLVTATSADGIHKAAIHAVQRLAGDDAAIRFCEETEDGIDLVVVSATGGERDVTGWIFPIDSLQSWKRKRLISNESYIVSASESVLRDPLALPREDDGSVLVTPMFIRDEMRGILVVATPTKMPRSVSEALRALAAQVALALESAALTEDLLLQQSQERFASLVKNSTDVITVVEPDTTIRFASPSSAGVLGYEAEELEGTPFANLVHPEDKTHVLSFVTAAEGTTDLIEFRALHHDGSYRFMESLRTNLLHDPNVRGIVLNTRDISERKEFEEQLQHQAFHDSLTNLANRALFRDRVVHALERQQRERRPIAVLFLDLDDFKTVNDSLGHAAGDELLGEVGERIRSCLRAADTAARLGGDEFAILLEDGGDGIEAVDVAERIMRAFEAPFLLEDKEVFAGVSIGIAVHDGSSQADVEEVLRNADVAMYMAKDRGKGRYQVFETEMHDTALRRLELKADLQRALEHREFILHYQPVIELGTGTITGVEALIRWIHPVRGLVPPLDFIPLAEETGLIVPIGRWVLQEACRFAQAMNEGRGGNPFHMAVNLSARQLARPEIVDEVGEILEDTGVDPRALVLEITESVMMQDMDMSIERLTALKELGVQLAIDDFGTGYSSLNYVRRFPVDILKVDKSFIDGVSEGGESAALTAAVIELAGILNLRPVAEGIERADQLERLLEMRCDLGQGYFFAKPLPPDELETLLAEREAMQAEADALAGG
jgi:diguanylate cyclase (GGDEF)-like protein/PAS domain S-box-containing protein